MHSEHVLFFSSCAFIGGTVLGGLGLAPLGALVLAFLAVLPFIIRFRLLALVCAISFFAGNTYFAIDDFQYRARLADLSNVTSFEGRIIDFPRESTDARTVEVELDRRVSGVEGRVYVRTELERALSYGDVLSISGEVVPPPLDSYGDYLAKERVHGTLFYPDIEVVGHRANPMLGILFSIRAHLKENLERLFAANESAFLAGIVLGDKDGFSPEFRTQLSLSGTMHLMALSGLNMTIIIFAALAFFSLVLRSRQRSQFIATFSLVALFVAMTGFQVSAVRAALMAFLVGLADATHRLYSPHMGVVFAALVITLANPKAPVFDLGFQLSFLATLAILYLTPVLLQFRFFKQGGFLGWREILAITLAAQIGVAPLTIMQFGNFSLTGIFANIGVLAVIPFLTVAGFLVAVLYSIFPPLAALLAEPMSFLIGYVTLVIETFAALYVPFNPPIGAVSALLYYAVLIWIVWRFSPIKHENSR